MIDQRKAPDASVAEQHVLVSEWNPKPQRARFLDCITLKTKLFQQVANLRQSFAS